MLLIKKFIFKNCIPSKKEFKTVLIFLSIMMIILVILGFISIDNNLKQAKDIISQNKNVLALSGGMRIFQHKRILFFMGVMMLSDININF